MFQTPGRVSFHDKNPRRAPQQISLGRMETMELPFPFPVLIIQPPHPSRMGNTAVVTSCLCPHSRPDATPLS